MRFVVLKGVVCGAGGGRWAHAHLPTHPSLTTHRRERRRDLHQRRLRLHSRDFLKTTTYQQKRACVLRPPSPCAGVGLCGGVLWWIERNGRKMVEAPSSSHLNTTQPFHQPTLPTTGDLYPTTPLLMCLYGKEGGVAVVVANQAFAAAFMPAERISA